jgi:hypothetical protein
MKHSRFTVFIHSFAGIMLLALLTPAAFAQGASAANALGQLSMALSGGHAVQSVQLSGNATWHVGSQEDSGSVTLTASSNGSSQMQLSLASAGQRTESQIGSGSGASCQWAGNDGVAHAIQSGACWRPTLWFLPAFSLQPSLLPANLTVADLGTGTVGASATPYRHLQSRWTVTGAPASLTADVARWSKTDIGLNPTSLLPAVLAYSVRPDNGAPLAIAVEAHYSDYHDVNGVQIPFTIQRYVNGSLQLQISVRTAQVN